MTEAWMEQHIRNLARGACANKHGDQIGQDAVPCPACIKQASQDYEKKRQTAHGQPLSDQEAAVLRQRLGRE